jgi:hypothetical protein
VWGAAALLVVVVVVGLPLFFLRTYAPPPVDPAWAVEGASEIPEGAVTVRYTGTSTLVFSDGETTWMTDGWFSRPPPVTVLFGEIVPDLDAIERGLTRNGVDELNYDHAMDAPEVARRTGAGSFRSIGIA